MRTPIDAGGQSRSSTAAGANPTATDASLAAAPAQSSVGYGNPGAQPAATQLLSNVATTSRGIAPLISATTTSSRCSTSMPTSTAATWATSATRCERSWTACARSWCPALDGRAGPGGDDAKLVLTPRAGLDSGGHSGVPADGGELPVVARPVHHPDAAARRHGGHSVDAVHHPDHAQRAVADGRHHVHRQSTTRRFETIAALRSSSSFTTPFSDSSRRAISTIPTAPKTIF